MSPLLQVKSLPSQLDEISAVLSGIPAPLQDVPAVTAFQNGASPAGSPAPAAASARVLDWSSLPAAVGPDSKAMGVSTKKRAAYKPAKQKPVNVQKVQARAARKRAQVESFLLVLRPLLESAGHSLAAAVHAAGSRPQQACSSCSADLPTDGQQQAAQQQQQQGQQQAAQTGPMRLHIVDFGCGSGNLLLPLAALLPGCHFTGVDMKPAALALLMTRAAAAGLSNVAVFEGMIEQYRQPFDVALALHACGNATDHVLQIAVEQRAAFAVSPCCVGKLRFSITGGTSFHSKPIAWTPTQPGDQPVRASTGTVSTQPHVTHPRQATGCTRVAGQQQQQEQQLQQQQGAGAGLQQPQLPEQQEQAVPRLRHPRSDWLMHHLPDPETHFKIMAKVADVSHAPTDRAELADALQQRMHVADMCKRFVELDRCAAAAEAGYAVGLFKVLQADSMAKNDLLVGLPLPQSLPQPGAVTQAGRAAAAAVDNGDDEEPGQQVAASEAVHDCFSRCGQALHASSVLFGREQLCTSGPVAHD